jgi:FkbM family methyltransferase
VGMLPRRLGRISRELRRIDCSPFSRLVLFDVGAHDGTTFAGLARALPWIHVYAFEPTPELAAVIERAHSNLGNYHLVRKAIGETPGKARFNVVGRGDWGCSSLLDFSDGLERTWPGRTDFEVTRTIEVDVMRLDTFVAERGISRIDFLHVDAQGVDLQVLRSLGEHIALVKGGVIEVPQSAEVKLYRGQHTREEALEFLRAHGFEIRDVIPQQNEDNVYFRRPRT